MKFILNKDNLNIEGSQVFNSGSTGYYEIEVEYDEEWQDLTVAVVMIKKGESIGKNVSVVNNKVCIDRAAYGSYSLGVIGYKIENEQKIYQISTNLKSVYFNKGAGEIETQNEAIPTASEWEVYAEQLKTIADDLKNELNNEVSATLEKELKERLESGEFNGENGATFAPSVDEDGNLSWTNDKGLPNPETTNIKGPKGEGGASFKVSTTLPEANSEGYSVLEPNTKYYLGEMEEISIAFPEGELGQEIDVQFISREVGEKLATTLNIDNDNINENFTYSLSAKKIYELKATYGVIGIKIDNTVMYGWNLTLNETEMVDRRLPYIPVEYIESSGTQYIDTGLILTDVIPEDRVSTMYVEIEMEASDISKAHPVCGIYHLYQSVNPAFSLGVNGANAFSLTLSLDGAKTVTCGSSTALKNDTRYKVRMGNAYLENLTTGEKIEKTAFTTVSGMTAPFYIFRQHRTDNIKSMSSYKLYSFKVSDGDNLIMELIPVKDLTGIACLYDKVSKTFFYNKGTGDFVAGPDM